MATTPEGAREFLTRAKLPAPPQPSFQVAGAPGTIEEALDTAKNQAAVVGSNVVSFVKGVTAERREDIVNSSLLAQLVASNETSPDNLVAWYSSYFRALESIGWVIQNKTQAVYTEETENFSTHEAILAVATVLLGAAPTALAVVKSTLDALKSMDQNSPWITLFSRESQSGTTAHFQVTLVDQSPDGDFLVSLMAFGLEAKFELTQVLFFKFRTAEATLRHYSGSVTINTAVLDGIRDDLRAKLVDHAKDYIRTLPDLKPAVGPRRIVAHFMHESEREKARMILGAPLVTDSFLMGQSDSYGIELLRASGLIVQELDDHELPVSTGEFVDTSDTMPSAAGASFGTPTFVTRRSRGRVTSDGGFDLPDLSVPRYYRMWLSGPLLEEWREELAGLDALPDEALPGGAYTVRLAVENVPKVKGLSFVRDVRLYDEAATRTARSLEKRAFRSGGTDRPTVTYDILLHRADGAEETLTWLKKRDVAILGAKGRRIRIELPEESQMLDEIAGLTAVARMEPYVKPKLLNDRARAIMGIDLSNSGHAIQQTGAGEIIAVADTGIDESHPDFAGRLIGKSAWGRTRKTDDPNGHGTHVAGSAVGDGSASAGQFRGTAPGAKLYFQSLLDDEGGLGGLPLALSDLFDDAYAKGARVHNNSWGAETASQYVINSQEVDEYVAQHRDMLIVIAAGNEGTARRARNATPGYVDWLSIGSPASCKNGLTVGASRSDRTTGGYASRTWNELWPADYPDPPIATETVSGNPEGLAAFSSRGPCDDRRIKPDLVAPGTDILSCRSGLAPKKAFWGEYTSNPRYSYSGGTSMAAPLVAGCAALVREYYAGTRQHQPSASLLKATLINGTRWLGHADSTAPRAGFPNYHQGFGCVDMPATIPNAARPKMVLEFVDEWQSPGKAFKATGNRARFVFEVKGPCPGLRICLAYTDIGARALQNNLNLFLQLPDSTKRWGNEKLPDTLNIPDTDNNVEVIRLDAPAVGMYLIQVSATNILKGPQDFALVVTGENLSTLTRI